MADDPDSNDTDKVRPGTELEQHPRVSQLRPDPAKPPKAVIDLVGLPGPSTRPGYQRLYLTTVLDYFAEFLAEDMLYSTRLPLEQSPFPGHEAVLVSIRREATIDYTWTRQLQPVDEFDLDVRLEASSNVGTETPAAAGRSGFTSCTGCSLGVSCAICPSQLCPPRTRPRTCPV
jgi:hypothetical protein